MWDETTACRNLTKVMTESLQNKRESYKIVKKGTGRGQEIYIFFSA